MTDYPDSLDVRPLTTWPGRLTPDNERHRSAFSAPMRTTTQQLARELDHLLATHPVLEVAIDPQQFRRDGRPRMGARAQHPGVVLTLPDSAVGPLRYATDTFTTWQDNLRAITLGMEALRKVDRYGITKRGEQYAGFKQLGSGSAVAVPAAMSVDEAAQLMCKLADLPAHHAARFLHSEGSRKQAYRYAVRVHHPDRGGDRATWDRLEQAKRVLDAHTGRT